MNILKSFSPRYMVAPRLERCCQKVFQPIFRQQVRGVQDHTDYMKEYYIKIIGNREIVGFGCNGQPFYTERPEFPFPAIRYKEPTSEILALREKERGDWRRLTIREKKKLYRYSFRQTFAEMLGKKTQWMAVIGIALWAIALSFFMQAWLFRNVYGKPPDSFSTRSWLYQLARIIAMHNNPLTGYASMYDYNKMEWKNPNGLFTPINPFMKCDQDVEKEKLKKQAKENARPVVRSGEPEFFHH